MKNSKKNDGNKKVKKQSVSAEIDTAKSPKRKNDGFKASMAIICILAVISLSCCGYLALGHLKPDVASDMKDAFTFLYSDESTTANDETNDEPDVQESTTARLMFAGENIIYDKMYKQAQDDDGSYDFSAIYSEVKEIIGESDIAMINQVTVLSDDIQASSYPRFCTPTALGNALVNAGFNVINHASKNTWDKGEDGLEDTLVYWKTKSTVLLTGIYEDENDLSEVKIKQANGIKFAFIPFTCGLNTSGYSSEDGVQILTLDENGKSQVDVYNQLKHMIKDAKEKADVVIVAVNFSGNEEKEATSDQVNCINYMVSFGADVVIGTGTNSVQPIEIRDNADGTKAVIASSLGNFMSSQTDKENMLGAIADIIYSKDEDGNVKLESAKLIPTVTMIEKGYTNYQVVPFSTLSDTDDLNHAVSGFTYDFASEYFDEVIPENYRENFVKDTEELLGSAEETTEPESTEPENTEPESTED